MSDLPATLYKSVYISLSIVSVFLDNLCIGEAAFSKVSTIVPKLISPSLTSPEIYLTNSFTRCAGLCTVRTTGRSADTTRLSLSFTIYLENSLKPSVSVIAVPKAGTILLPVIPHPASANTRSNLAFVLSIILF